MFSNKADKLKLNLNLQVCTFFLGRKTYLTKLTVQGKSNSSDFADNVCVGSTVDGVVGVQYINQTFRTCLVRK